MTKKKDIRWRRPVLCVDDGRVWVNAKSCAKDTGIPYTSLIYALDNGNAIKGRYYVEADDETLEQYMRSKEIKEGDRVYMRTNPNNPGVVESIKGDVVCFRFDSPIELCECMREQLVKVETN